MSSSTINPAEYEAFSKYLETTCGIVLGDNKQYLVTSRLSRVMVEYKLETLGQLMDDLKSNLNKNLKSRIIEAMTTNETSWFRDVHPFNCLKEKIFPELGRNRKNPVRIWSAACSSGQEPYSISITAHEFQMSNPGALSGNLEIVATDISPAVVRAAEKGRYDAMAISRGLSPERKQRYFQETPAYWSVIPQIRSRVKFRELNLLQSYALLGKFDVIFCRNVLIYFSSQSKADILNRMCSTLNPAGYLFLGGSESITGLCDRLDMVHTQGGVVYQLKP